MFTVSQGHRACGRHSGSDEYRDQLLVHDQIENGLPAACFRPQLRDNGRACKQHSTLVSESRDP